MHRFLDNRHFVFDSYSKDSISPIAGGPGQKISARKRTIYPLKSSEMGVRANCLFTAVTLFAVWIMRRQQEVVRPFTDLDNRQSLTSLSGI